MTTKEKINRIRELNKIEETLKERKDFERLIEVHDESMKILNSVVSYIDRIPQKAYCLARIGKKNQALRTLEELKTWSFFADQNELYRSVTLVSFFLESNVTNLSLIQINTIKSWLKNPDSSKQVIRIIFDYSDIIGDVKPFDETKLEVKQTNFSKQLQECVFYAMGRDENTMVYYNRETNDVQQEVEGYLSSHMASDQSLENRRLSSRILNSEETDPIIDGLHFLIPRLSLINFLDKFEYFSSEHYGLIDFVGQFKSIILDKYREYSCTIEDIMFTENVSNMFFNNLNEWYNQNNFSFEVLDQIIIKTKLGIGLEFLKSVNK